MQREDTLQFLVSIKDRVNAAAGDSENDNVVQVPITVIVLDDNDNPPEFQNVSRISFVHYRWIQRNLQMKARWKLNTSEIHRNFLYRNVNWF